MTRTPDRLLPFLLRRAGWFLLTLFAVITISFFLMRSVRGGPFDQDRVLHPAAKEAIEARYHLDWPLWKQYVHYLGGVATLDLGPSFRLRDYTVNDIIAESFPVSALLGLAALLLALGLGIPFGILAALRKDSLRDHLFMSAATLGMALPNFVISTLLILIFAFTLPLFPPAGWGGWQHLFLPALALALPFAAYISRLTRTGMLEVLGQDYIRTAMAKGLAERRVVLRHAIKGAILPVVSYLGPAAAGILTGSLVIEKIFAIPGLGTHFINAALNRDYTLALGVTILYTSLVYLLNLAVDIAYTLLDRRIRLE